MCRYEDASELSWKNVIKEQKLRMWVQTKCRFGDKLATWIIQYVGQSSSVDFVHNERDSRSCGCTGLRKLDKTGRTMWFKELFATESTLKLTEYVPFHYSKLHLLESDESLSVRHSFIDSNSGSDVSVIKFIQALVHKRETSNLWIV